MATAESKAIKKDRAARAVISALRLDIDFKVSEAYQKKLSEMFLNNLNRMSWEALQWFSFALLNDLSHPEAQKRAAALEKELPL